MVKMVCMTAIIIAFLIWLGATSDDAWLTPIVKTIISLVVICAGVVILLLYK